MKFKAGDVVWSPWLKDLIEVIGFDPFEHSYRTAPLVVSSRSGIDFYNRDNHRLIRAETLDKNTIKVSKQEAYLIRLLFG